MKKTLKIAGGRGAVLAVLTLLLSSIAGLRPEEADKERALEKLSDYGFFEGRLAGLQPAEGVWTYALNSALFSDYAGKDRFVFLPRDSSMGWQDREVLDMPIGTVLIKNFYYPAAEAEGDAGRRILETRLLKHTKDGWLAWPYWWNDEQTEAYYKPLGGRASVEIRDAQGKTREIEYRQPNQMQCKSCHNFNGQIRPIGPSVRQLHGGEGDYLRNWVKGGLVSGAPADEALWPRMDWKDEAMSLEYRARAYLDANCGYCHRHEGQGSSSGLMLAWHYPTGAQTGIRKAPVAAGKGSGGRKFDIKPGDAEASILYYRMVENDPSIRMPELGRTVADEEGLAVVKAWIEGM